MLPRNVSSCDRDRLGKVIGCVGGYLRIDEIDERCSCLLISTKKYVTVDHHRASLNAVVPAVLWFECLKSAIFIYIYIGPCEQLHMYM